MVVVVPAALACKLSRVDHEPTICQMLKMSHSAVHAAHIQTAHTFTTTLPWPAPGAGLGSAPAAEPAFPFLTGLATTHPQDDFAPSRSLRAMIAYLAA